MLLLPIIMVLLPVLLLLYVLEPIRVGTIRDSFGIPEHVPRQDWPCVDATMERYKVDLVPEENMPVNSIKVPLENLLLTTTTMMTMDER